MKNIYTLIEQYKLIQKGSRVVVGLSGGPDSVFLLSFFAKELQRGNISKLIAAHLDHEWRPESGKEVEFCRKLAKKNGARFATSKISKLSISLKFNGSKEEFARKARRHFFESVKKQYDAHVIALAHHAQDQQETFFIRLIRGATLTGLTGMRPKHGNYIRPLLKTNKQEILDFLHKNNIPYLNDPTNSSEQFLRNRIRNTALPALHQCDNRFDQKFATTIDQLQATESFLQIMTQKLFSEIALKQSGFYHIHAKDLTDLHPVMRQRIILHWLCEENVSFNVSKNFFGEIEKFLESERGGSHQLGTTWSIMKKKGVATIKKF